MIKLSIVIPAYNAEPYIYELLDRLEPQITDEVQVIVIDDCSKKPLNINKPWVEFYKNDKNRGVSYTRNRGIELSKGLCIHFIDADDMVASNYVQYIINLIDTKEFDFIDLSWKSLPGGIYFDYKLNNDLDALPNPSASTRVFKREFIGDTRFPINKDAAEDEYFTRHLGLKTAKHVCATQYMYFYRTGVEDSGSKRYLKDECKTKRIVYFFKHVTKDMDYLIDEFKREDEVNEVFLMTHQNDLPELEKYCQLWNPNKPIRAMEGRGEPTKMINVIPKPIETQVVIYTATTFEIGGIETFIYSFCKQMHKYYDIMVLYDTIATNQLVRLSRIVKCLKNDPNVPIRCDSIIINRISDRIPQNVTAKQSIQMAHCIKQQPSWHIPQDKDYIVNVSQASKDSFGEEAKNGIVIHNLTTDDKTSDALLLVSALRVGADDKQGNDERCKLFAKMLDQADIPYIWLYFGDKPMKNAPERMIYAGCTLNIKPYIKMADYYVGLSGSEAFSYSLLEALELQVPLLVTPLEQNKDMKIVDGENAYIVPFDVEKFDVKKILNIPKFEYKYDNAKIIKQWRKLLGNTTPKGDYVPSKEVFVIVNMDYFDIKLNETLHINNRRQMPYERAMELRDKGFVRIIE